MVLEERNQRTDNDPGALFGEQRSAAQYLYHPYGVPVIGWRHEIAALTLDDALALLPASITRPTTPSWSSRAMSTLTRCSALAEKHYGPLDRQSRRCAPRGSPAGAAAARPSGG